jgi:hypothetical protein
MYILNVNIIMQKNYVFLYVFYFAFCRLLSNDNSQVLDSDIFLKFQKSVNFFESRSHLRSFVAGLGGGDFFAACFQLGKVTWKAITDVHSVPTIVMVSIGVIFFRIICKILIKKFDVGKFPVVLKLQNLLLSETVTPVLRPLLLTYYLSNFIHCYGMLNSNVPSPLIFLTILLTVHNVNNILTAMPFLFILPFCQAKGYFKAIRDYFYYKIIIEKKFLFIFKGIFYAMLIIIAYCVTVVFCFCFFNFYNKYLLIHAKKKLLIKKALSIVCLICVCLTLKSFLSQKKDFVFFAESITLIIFLIQYMCNMIRQINYFDKKSDQAKKYDPHAVIGNQLDAVSQKLYYDDIIHISALYEIDKKIISEILVALGTAFLENKNGIAADSENLFPALMLELILIQYHYYCNERHLYCKDAIPDHTRWYSCYYNKLGFSIYFEDTLKKNFGEEEGTNLMNELSSFSEYCGDKELSFEDAVTGLYRIVYKKRSQIHNEQEGSQEKKFCEEKKELNEEKVLHHPRQGSNNVKAEGRVKYIENLLPSNPPSIQDQDDKKVIAKIISDGIPQLLISAKTKLEYNPQFIKFLNFL